MIELSLPWKNVRLVIKRHGECLISDRFRDLYSEEKNIWLDTKRYDHFISGRLLVNHLLNLDEKIRVGRLENGRPVPPEKVLLSLSHDEEYSCCVVSEDLYYESLGVDILKNEKPYEMKLRPGVTGFNFQNMTVTQEITFYESVLKTCNPKFDDIIVFPMTDKGVYRYQFGSMSGEACFISFGAYLICATVLEKL